MSRKGKAGTRGFTLVELMIGIITGAIFMLTVGSLLVFGWKSWMRNAESVEMQRDASLAMRVMAREIRNASNITVEDSSLTCQNLSGTVRFIQDGNDLDMEENDVFKMHLVRNAVAGFSPTATGDGGVSIDLQLVTDADHSRMQQTIYRRD